MKLLCISAQIPGHLDWGGYLSTASELARRGHDVLWASGAAVRTHVEIRGVPFHTLSETGWRWPPPPPLPSNAAQNPEALKQMKQLRALDQWLDVERVSAATDELIDLIGAFKPDLVLSEMFTGASGLAAEATDTPLIVAGWPASVDTPPPPDAQMPAMVVEARERLDALLAQYDLSGTNWTRYGPPALTSPFRHITYWSPSWYGDRPMGQQTVHVGGSCHSASSKPPDDLPSPQDAPWVLITLGTSFNRDPAFFVNTSHAADRMHCRPIVALGDSLDEAWVQELTPRLPDSAVVRDRVDFATVLPHCAAAIHHGGAGTTHALVMHAIPQIVVPHAADQAYQAAGVNRSGIGLYIRPRKATIDALRIGLSALLPDLSAYRSRAREVQTEFRELGGIARAADLIEELANPKSTTEQHPTGGRIASTD